MIIWIWISRLICLIFGVFVGMFVTIKHYEGKNGRGGSSMVKALVDITEEMQNARACCGEDSDCNECPCQIGTYDCVYNHEMEAGK